MTNPFDTRIEESKNLLQRRRDEVEGARENFFAALTSDLQVWVVAEAERKVKASYDVTKALGASRVAAMKAELTALTAALPGLVRQWLGADALWAHRSTAPPRRGEPRPSPIWYRTEARGHGPSELWKPVRSGLTDTLGQLLEKYGYHVVHRDRQQAPQLMLNFDWSEAPRAAINRYQDALDALQKAEEQLNGAICEKGEHEAASIWNKS